MKTFLLICIAALLICGLAFSACKKSSQSLQSKGVINLDVLYTCNNCQGSSYDIAFANDTVKYHISNDLTQFGITTSAKFPVNVSVNWQPDNTVNGNFVTITSLKVDN